MRQITQQNTAKRHYVKLVLAMFAIAPTSAALACASCGCTLSSDWGAQGLSSQAGWSVDVRYDTLDQDQLRTGTGTLSALAASKMINSASHSAAEVEQYTHNQYLTTTIDYNQGSSWGLSVIVPYISRSHSTYGSPGNTWDGVTFDAANGAYTSQRADFGDVRVVARYYGFSEQQDTGIQVGLKLPTGGTAQVGNDGVTAVDPGLQVGTGTTDLILGAYHFDNISQNWDYFVQTQFQYALAPSYLNNGGAPGSYRPGDSVNLTGGFRYHGYESFTPEIQINARYVDIDSGTIADTYSTGGTLVYVSPGVSIPLSDKVALHGSVQLPIYQNVNGIQLAPTAIYSVGVRVAF